MRTALAPGPDRCLSDGGGVSSDSLDGPGRGRALSDHPTSTHRSGGAPLQAPPGQTRLGQPEGGQLGDARATTRWTEARRRSPTLAESAGLKASSLRLSSFGSRHGSEGCYGGTAGRSAAIPFLLGTACSLRGRGRYRPSLAAGRAWMQFPVASNPWRVRVRAAWKAECKSIYYSYTGALEFFKRKLSRF